MATRKKTKKKNTKKKVSRKSTARKTTAKRKSTKKKAAKKKVARKTTKKKVARKSTKKKASKKKASKKKVAKKKVTKRKTSKKKVARKSSKKKATKKKTAKKKVAKKKTAKRKTSAKKKVTKKATSKKSASKKTTGKKTTAKKAANKYTAPTKVAVARVRAVKPEKRKKNADALKPSSFGPIHGVDPYKPKRGEAYMSSDMQNHFRDVLHAWKRDLMEEVDRTMDHMQDDAANFPDPSDRATQESEFSLELRTRDRERKLLKKINGSLEDLSLGDYGYCEACGIEIGLRRLEARPTAGLCIDCKTLDEIREKQRGK
ncbi:MAG: RNA polymerase-binding protein DksA [Gammaproteobacteria bacterium]|nr:RNA polymerase-binding protein DksA [Gammaproteobacteria bacterium]NNC98056.1 RNA polymerase-binding protein DksA [Gammaproteobacteria bacterium]NNM14606.1 RNA polymerase-binding protein DksA [Gammaproteobacteria bacterium]